MVSEVVGLALLSPRNDTDHFDAVARLNLSSGPFGAEEGFVVDFDENHFWADRKGGDEGFDRLIGFDGSGFAVEMDGKRESAHGVTESGSEFH